MVEWVARRATARVEAKAGARVTAAAFQDWGGAATQKEEEGREVEKAVESGSSKAEDSELEAPMAPPMEAV